MKTSSLHLSLGAAAILLSAQAWAQPPEKRAETVSPPTTVADNSRPAPPAPVKRTFTAAGSVIVLVDGKVASARIAPVPAPAPGFVYER